MPTETNGRMPLIGVIDAGTRTVKFCVFRSQQVEELDGHDVDVTPKVPEEGWHEQDPMEILQSVKTCIEHVTKNLQNHGKYSQLICG